jgi:serine/threonine protein kinase
VAVKKMPIARRKKIRNMAQSEAKQHGQARHPNIVQFMGIMISMDEVWIISEKIDGVSMEKVIGEKKLPEHTKELIAQDCLKGLAYLHAKSIIHNDIKPGNILIENKDNKAKICDFGLAKLRRSGGVTTVAHGMIDGHPCLYGNRGAFGQKFRYHYE